MAKLRFIMSCFWICLARTVVSEDLYHKVGGELVLKPDKSTVPGPNPSILWKHGKNKVAEWDKDFGGLEIYAAFKGRTTLDQTTGELRISGLTKTDSGVYFVEFNGKLLDKTYKLSVIKEVPKPTITSSCNPDKTSCTLTCEGNTTDAEPVTYSWKVGEGEWEVIDKQMNVSKSDTGNSNNGYKYICKLNNAVSGEGEVSEPVEHVFGPEPSEVGVGAGVVVVILVLVATIIVWLVWKKKNGYPEDTWIDFLTKFCGRVFGDAVNNQNSIAPDTVYHTVGDDQVANRGVSGVLSGVAMDTVYSTVGEKTPRDYSMNQNDNNQPTNTAKPSDGNNQTTGSAGVQPEQEVTVPLTDINITGKEDADKAGKRQENGAKGSDGVQPEQGVKVPQTANPKTGEDDADKVEKGQGKGAAEASRSDSPKEKSEPDAKGSDGVQPKQGVKVPQTANPKTGEDDADKVEKGQGKGGAEASGSDSPKEKSEPEGSDIVQPEQGVKVPQTANPKTGEDDVDNAVKGQENGAAEASGSNSPKDESKPEETTPFMDYKDSQ